MARHKTEIAIAAYMAGMKPHRVEAYQTRPDSRFAIAKPFGNAKNWDLRHVASGLSFGSILPGGPYSLAQLLAAVKAVEAHTEIDLSPLDDVEFGKGFTRRPPDSLLQSIRDAACAAVLQEA